VECLKRERLCIQNLLVFRITPPFAMVSIPLQSTITLKKH
jgi:hypothetical protein